MPNPWSGGQKSNITAIETAITTALGSLGSPNDPWQQGTRQTLLAMMRLLDNIKVERNA